MKADEIYSKLADHVRGFFNGHQATELVWTLGPIQRVLPRFRVLCVAPGPRSSLWVYVSLGAWELHGADVLGLEFMIFAPDSRPRYAELLAMCAYYHSRHRLGLGHTCPIGEPWIADSRCDHYLVSLPYPFGSDLEVCDTGAGLIHLSWLLPITRAERDFKVQNGLEALEERFEAKGLEYWRADRASVV